MTNTQTIKLNAISNETYYKLFNKGCHTYNYFEPGMCFLSPWIFSPLQLTDSEYIKNYSKRYYEKLLSFDYWVNWRSRRPPISVILPNKQSWCLDERLNGVDRDVSGTFPFVSVDKPAFIDNMLVEIQNGTMTYKTSEIKEKLFLSDLVMS